MFWCAPLSRGACPRGASFQCTSRIRRRPCALLCRPQVVRQPLPLHTYTPALLSRDGRNHADTGDCILPAAPASRARFCTKRIHGCVGPVPMSACSPCINAGPADIGPFAGNARTRAVCASPRLDSRAGACAFAASCARHMALAKPNRRKPPMVHTCNGQRHFAVVCNIHTPLPPCLNRWPEPPPGQRLAHRAYRCCLPNRFVTPSHTNKQCSCFHPHVQRW